MKFSLRMLTTCKKNYQLKVSFALQNMKCYCFLRNSHANTKFAVMSTVCRGSHLNNCENNNNSQLHAGICTQKLIIRIANYSHLKVISYPTSGNILTYDDWCTMANNILGLFFSMTVFDRYRDQKFSAKIEKIYAKIVKSVTKNGKFVENCTILSIALRLWWAKRTFCHGNADSQQISKNINVFMTVTVKKSYLWSRWQGKKSH